MIKLNKTKYLILISLLVTGLVAFGFSAISVLAEDEDPDGVQTEELEPYCGDGNLDDGEECDEGGNNGVECTPEYGSICNYCSIDCETVELTGPYCGDGNLDDGEECDDGNTEDGDGCAADCTIEEGPTPECEPETTQSCDTGLLGVCATGTQTCDQEGFWGECIADSEPGAEICDNSLDDDCDGEIDCADVDCNEDSACSQNPPEGDTSGEGGEVNDCGEGIDCEDLEEIIEEAIEGECEEGDCEIHIVSGNEAEVENDVADFGSTGNNQIGVSQDESGEEGEIDSQEEEGTETEEEGETEGEETGVLDEEDEGDNIIETGDVNLVVGLFNTVNSNIIGSNFFQFLFNIFEDSEGDINLADEIATSSEGNCSSSAACLNIVDDNQGSIENDVLIGGSTGNNSVNSDNGDAIIKTGNANAVANIFNVLNSNIIGLNWTRFIINIFGDWMGDLILPGKEAMQQFNEQGSSGCGGNCQSTNMVSSNEGQIENEVYVTANTGGNTASGNSSVIRTGNANVKTDVLNIANSNINNQNWFFMGINNFGNWKGEIFNLPPGLAMKEDFGGIKIYNLGLDDFNSNSTESGTLNIVNNNSGFIKNTVIVNVSTGGNSANSSNGSAVINTGDANVFTSLVNILNSNITGNNMLSGMVNIFGNWEGDVAFGRPDLFLGESVITSSNPAEPGGLITYTLTYFNNGDADATGVTIVDDFDERYLSVTDVGGGTVIDNPGELQWDIGTVPAGSSGSVSYSAAINYRMPGGTTYLINQAVIDSLEDDWNDEDNIETISVEAYRGFPFALLAGWPSQSALPDLQITKTNNVEDFVYAGNNVDYQIVLTNNGDGSAYDAVVEDVLLNEFSEVIITNSWDLGEVFPNEEIIIDYTVAIGSEVPAGFYTNTAQAIGIDSQESPASSPQASTTIEIRVSEAPLEEILEEEPFEEFEEEEISLEEIEGELGEIESTIEKIREEINRLLPEIPAESLISYLPEILVPEVLAQEEPDLLAEESEIKEEEEEEAIGEAEPKEGLEKFLAAIGSFFSPENLWWILILAGLVLLIISFLPQRKK